MPWPRRSLESVLKRRVDRTPVELIEHHDYQYKPLKQGGEETVRVFVLFPAASRGDPLVCHLIERALDKFCHEALSYVWGGSNHKRPIYCADHGQNQGGRLEITQNLDEALRAIRTKRSVRSIWVDALCINQQDADERIRQIPLMEDRFIQGPREHSSGWAKVTNILLDYLGSTGGTVILGECPGMLLSPTVTVCLLFHTDNAA